MTLLSLSHKKMNRKNNVILFTAVMLFVCSCSNTEKSTATNSKDSIGKQTVVSKTPDSLSKDDPKRAKKWLLNSIANRYKPDGEEDTTIKMYTKQYEQYKSDAINREYDGLTEAQFENKWKDKYNVKFATSNSILIGQQDWINPRVTHCELKKMTADKSFLFSVIIDDGDSKTKYTHRRDIKVTPFGSTFLIDDILEYD